MDAPHLSSLVGQHVGKYRITAPMGQRGLGAVYEVVQDSIGHRAVVKILAGQLADDPRHQKYAARYLDEARAVNYLDSPGVVKIFDFGERPDRSVYVLMEYLEGELLSDRLGRLRAAGARVDPEGAVRLTRQVAGVLTLAHGKGIVHRDMRPDNVLVVPDREAPGGERVKILDFGLAKFLDTPERRTTAGLTLGSPTYMSPEQCLGSDEIGAPTDVYSLGVLCYEMLAGRPPFEGEMRAMLVAHLNQAPAPLAQLVPVLPAALVQLVHGMLAKKPAERPTMAQVDSVLGDIEARGLLKAPAPGGGAASGRAALLRFGLPAGLAAAGLAIGLVCGRTLLAPAPPPAPACPPAAVAEPAPAAAKPAPPPAPPKAAGAPEQAQAQKDPKPPPRKAPAAQKKPRPAPRPRR